MSELKTTVNEASVKDFINSVEGDTKRSDSFALLEMFTKITGKKPKMWGTSIIGLGNIIISPKEVAKKVTGRWQPFRRENKV